MGEDEIHHAKRGLIPPNCQSLSCAIHCVVNTKRQMMNLSMKSEEEENNVWYVPDV